MQEDGSTVPEELTYPTGVQPTEKQSVAAAVAAYEEEGFTADELISIATYQYWGSIS
tara:strand:+ start:127 stop:297 length:171 start_codon:yes stop_codon:yes gene_type:complete